MDDGEFTHVISVLIGKNFQLKQTISIRANLDIILRIPDMRIFKREIWWSRKFKVCSAVCDYEFVLKFKLIIFNCYGYGLMSFEFYDILNSITHKI